MPRKPGSPAAISLTVTGTYTSGEKVEPEGFVMDRGSPYDPYPQGWDGLLLLTDEGAVSIHHVERLLFDGTLYNLKQRDDRRSFVEMAKRANLSAIQSHLIVVDRKVDVSKKPGAPRTRRRVLFTDADGHYGLYDSSPRTQTLYEAAVEVAARFAPEMALNLDMGSYDYCALSKGNVTINCGALDREQTAKLSNVLVFRQDAP